jgi:anti-sigma factor RsiW
VAVGPDRDGQAPAAVGVERGQLVVCGLDTDDRLLSRVEPQLLAARAEGELSAADDQRLGRHLTRCAPCSTAEARFRAGERAYREAPDAPPVAFAARAIMEALLHCAPTQTGVPQAAPAVTVKPSPPVEVEIETAAEPELEPAPAPVAVLTEEAPPETFVPEPFDEEPYEYAPEPTVTHVVAAERQETYEFDALPDEAFDLEEAPLAPADAPRPRRSPWVIVGLVVLALVVLAALAVVAIAVMGVRS